MLSLDFLFTEKVQSKRFFNNLFLKVICYILFCISQMIFCVCIPLSVITNFIAMPFLLILIGSIIYYYVRNNKNKTNVNPEKIETNKVENQNKNELIKQEYTQIKKLSQFMTEAEEKKAKEILYTIENNGKFGVINDKGEIIIPIEYEYIGFEKYGLTDDKFAAKKDGKYGYINYKNEIVADFVFDEEPYYLLSNGNVFIKKD